MPNQTVTSDTAKFRRLPEERPGQILDAAVTVFTDRGIAAAKLEEIAALAGVSKGTIYLYFPSKEELFREVVGQKVVPYLARADEADAAESATAALAVRRRWVFTTANTAEDAHCTGSRSSPRPIAWASTPTSSPRAWA